MDPKWEFNANQYVDFNKLDEADNPNVDEFFNFDMESGERVTCENEEILEKQDVICNDDDVPQKDSVKIYSSEVEEKKNRRPANLVTTWGEGIKRMTKQQGKSSTSSQPRVMTPKRAKLKAYVESTINAVRNSPRLNKAPKRLDTNTSEPRLKSSIRRRSSSLTSVVRYNTKPSATMPKTPEVMRRNRAKLMQGVKDCKVTQGVEAFKQKLASNSSKTQNVIKGETKVPSKTENSEAPNFNKMLRSYGKSIEVPKTSNNAGITKPVPFKLAPERKRRHSADTKKFVSQAELVANYHKETPQRFRSRPLNSVGTERIRHRSASPGVPRITIANTPQLSTRGRSRPVTVLSKEEREELELEEQKKNQFKAKGVGETLPKFKYGDVKKKDCTVPRPFHLTGSSKSLEVVSKALDDEAAKTFHARPVPKGIMSAPRGIPEKKVAPVIEPESPAFSLKERLANRKPKLETVDPMPVFEAIKVSRSAAHRGVPVTLPPPSKKSTKAEPFSFEQRDKNAQEKKEERIKQVIEEEKKAREFHAQPIMKEDVVKIRAVPKAAPTKPEPFKFKIEERVETRLNQWQASIEKELEEQRKAATFRATEAKVLEKVPFAPKPSEKPLSEISNFVLHSDRRAEEREAFDLKIKQKEADLAGAKRELEERREREAQEEVQRLRKAAVHKAQPIRNYKGLDIVPSDKPLTLPESPKFRSGSHEKKSANDSQASV